MSPRPVLIPFMSFTDSVLPREDYIWSMDWTVALWLATRTYPVLPKQDVMPSKIKILYLQNRDPTLITMSVCSYTSNKKPKKKGLY